MPHTTRSAMQTILRVILEYPADDLGRYAYSNRLLELGRLADAQLLADQLADPKASRTLGGRRAGVPLARTATLRRGFVEQVTVAPAALTRVGEILRDHPVRVVRVTGTPVVLQVYPAPEFVSPANPGRRLWFAAIGRAGRGGVPEPHSPATRAAWWPTRGELVAGVGGWLESLLAGVPEAARPGSGPAARPGPNRFPHGPATGAGGGAFHNSSAG